jgi:hypothetical protein
MNSVAMKLLLTQDLSQLTPEGIEATQPDAAESSEDSRCISQS